MLQLQTSLTVATDSKALHNITSDIANVIAQSRVTTGLCFVFVQHTSASLIIQENADPSVLRDLQHWMADIVPESRSWQHDDEGPDDMPAHVRCALTKTSETIPIRDGRLALGTWQGIYLWEHRANRHRRNLIVHVIGT